MGLIVPHMLRRLVGNDHLFLAPACFFGGGAFLTLCDAARADAYGAGRAPRGHPDGAPGGPFFLWLLVWRKISAG